MSRRAWFGAAAACLLLAAPALAETVTNSTYCSYEGLPNSARQTMIVIDGNVVVPESGPPLPENQGWRAFVTRFVDAADPTTRLNLDVRERVSVAISDRDGSGLSVLFTGCIPVFSAEEEAAFEGRSSVLDKFFGADWRSRWEKESEAFRRSALVALVSGVKGLAAPSADRQTFAQGGLVQSLSKSPLFSLDQGVPRLIVYTSLGLYDFPQADIPTIRATARVDARNQRVDLSRAELHFLSSANAEAPNARDYLDSFFLNAKARLVTLTGATGSLSLVNPPRNVAVYQGTINMGEGAQYPLRMRLATDVNGTVVNSWLEMQAVQQRYVPFAGILTCAGPEECRYVGDNVFAQIWSDDPDPDPECPPETPFGGLRNLEFTTVGDRLTGKVSDEVCFFTGLEDGLTFELTRIPNGLF